MLACPAQLSHAPPKEEQVSCTPPEETPTFCFHSTPASFLVLAASRCFSSTYRGGGSITQHSQPPASFVRALTSCLASAASDSCPCFSASVTCCHTLHQDAKVDNNNETFRPPQWLMITLHTSWTRTVPLTLTPSLSSCIEGLLHGRILASPEVDIRHT